MRKSTKVLSALAAAGLVAAVSTAFTGTGLLTSGQASAPQFVGGTVSQAVTGATLDSINYTFTDGTKTAVATAVLGFATTADNIHVGVVATGGARNGTWSCTDVASLGSTCTYTVGADGLVGYTNLDSLAVTVS
jgi:hypothetical protein